MPIVLALLSALSYGTADFAAGLASRSFDAGAVTGVGQVLGLGAAAVAVILFPGVGPKGSALEWGALSGLGSALGTLSLYHGLSVARMSVVATVSGVLTAVVPVIVGLGLGNHLSLGAAVGIVLAVPAIAMVSWQGPTQGQATARTGLKYGCLAGLGFGLLFVALDRAGTHSGAWPLIPGQLVSIMVVAPFAARGLRASERPSRRTSVTFVAAGLLSGTANLLFLAATGHGQLAIVAVLSALYPAVTVVLARVILAEHLTRAQAIGLISAAVAIVLVTVS